MNYEAHDSEAARPPRRRWRVVIALAAPVVLAIAWTALWYYAVGRAEATIAEWREREAKAGRIYACATQAIGGFPFRIEVRCTEPAAEFRAPEPSLSLKAKELVVVAQVYQPTLLISEATGPLTIAESGRAPSMAANWALAQSSVRGLPSAPERISIVLDRPTFTRLGGAAMETMAQAEHVELHAREAPRLPQDDPVIDIALSLAKTSFPGITQIPSQAANQPIDVEITGTLRGLGGLASKSWTQRLRELQAANGRLEVTQARVRQGEILAVGQGTLALTPRGTLDGQIRLTVAGIEQLMTVLGLDKAVAQLSRNALERVAPGFDLDKLAQGLGFGSRGAAGLAAAGAALLGQPIELEGRRAVALPLRFADGVAFLGPIRVGELPPLF